MLNKTSPLSIGILLLDAPGACADGAPDCVCRNAASESSPAAARRVAGSARPDFDATRVVERVALAAIRIGVVVLLAASIASLFAPVAA